MVQRRRALDTGFKRKRVLTSLENGNTGKKQPCTPSSNCHESSRPPTQATREPGRVSMDLDPEDGVEYAESDCSLYCDDDDDDDTRAISLAWYEAQAEKAIREKRFADAEPTLLRIISGELKADAMATARSHVRLAIVYTELNCYRDAINNFKLAVTEVAEDPNVAKITMVTLYGLAERMMDKQANMAALTVLNLMKDLDRNRACKDSLVISEVLNARVKVLIRLGKYEDALKACSKALKWFRGTGEGNARYGEKIRGLKALKIDLMRHCNNPNAEISISVPIGSGSGTDPNQNHSGSSEHAQARNGVLPDESNEVTEAEARILLKRFNLTLIDGKVAGSNPDNVIECVTDIMKTMNARNLKLFSQFWPKDKGFAKMDKDDSLPTILHMASCWGNYDGVKYLLSSGYPVNVTDLHGFTPLHYAVHEAHQLVIQVLLEAGADINHKSNKGLTPLHTAAEHNPMPGAAMMLLGTGAEVDSADKEGKTPLHIACQREDKKSIYRLLLDRGANINATDKKGNTPLHLAVVHKWPCTVEILLHRGADMTIANYQRKTALELATGKKNKLTRDIFAEERSMRESMDTDSP